MKSFYPISLCKWVLIFSFLLAFGRVVFSLLIVQESTFDGTEKVLIGTVVDYAIDGDKLSFTLLAKEKVVVTYFLKTEEEKENLSNHFGYGKVVEVVGTLERPSLNALPNTFNYQKYLYYQHIHYLFEAESVQVTQEESLLYRIKNGIATYIKKLDHSEYFLAFLLGDTSQLDMSYSRQNGISHLFAVSGMHISLFVWMLTKLVRKQSLIGQLITFLILSFYVFIVNFIPSVLRVVLIYELKQVRKYTGLNWTNREICIFVFFLMLIVDPFFLHNIGFQYSFGISFCFTYLKPKENKLFNLFYSSFIAFLVSLPISAMNFYEVNVLSILFNLFFIPYVTYLFYPACFVVLLFPFLMPIFSLLVRVFEWMNQMCATFTVGMIAIPKTTGLVWIFYGLVCWLFLQRPKRQKVCLVVLIFLVGMVKVWPKFSNNAFVYFLDVGQGEATLFVAPHLKEVFLIDTGGSLSFSKEAWAISKKKKAQSENIVTFLHSIGINKINTLVLSHGDYDHIGNALELLALVSIDKIILNQNEDTSLEAEIRRLYPEKIDSKLSSSFFRIQEYTQESKNENDASLVYRIVGRSVSFFMMGDVSQTIEKKIISLVYPTDIIKLGHHGSYTSSNADFLMHVQPDLAIISAGRNNRYHHPSEVTLDTLSSLRIPYFNTAEVGTICVVLYPNGQYAVYP